MGLCLGTFKPVADSQLSGGFSRTFLKSMFGLPKAPAGDLKIATHAHEFDHLAPEYTKGASISGVQRKLMMALDGDRLIPVAKGGRYIVKPAPPDLLHMPENEYAIMNLARAAGLRITECAVLPFADGEYGYVVKRFDMLKTGQRLFIEDGASLCNAHPKNKSSDALFYEQCLLTMYRQPAKKCLFY